jgi:hypothetical protein
VRARGPGNAKGGPKAAGQGPGAAQCREANREQIETRLAYGELGHTRERLLDTFTLVVDGIGIIVLAVLIAGQRTSRRG